jgi:uncharacterized protein (DUF433 family)
MLGENNEGKQDTMADIQSINLIAIDPNVRKGRPFIIGTGVTVADIAIVKIYHGQDADGIAEWYGLSLPQVYAALAYYYEHREAMDEQIHSLIRRAEDLAERRPGGENSLLLPG